MTFRHAGALTISGWLLLLPPTNGKNVTQGAPLEKWTNGGVYDSMEDCQGVIGRLQSGLRGRESETRPDAAQCVASDDRSLKEK